MPSPSAGTRLRRIRQKLGLTLRDVEELSHQIATKEGQAGYKLSHARLIQIESNSSTPGIHKLYTLAAIYGVSLSEVLSFYLNLEGIDVHKLSAGSQTTRLVEHQQEPGDAQLEFPVAFHEWARTDSTTLVSELVKTWGHVPLSFLKHLNLRRCRYGFIGLRDYMMHPLLRPGSFVQIADHRRAMERKVWATEFDRPLYFIESRSGYLCAWCEPQENRLLVIPHPLSPCKAREFKYPGDAEIIGRVTAVATPLGSETDSPKLDFRGPGPTAAICAP